ncbi:MAG TPA: hypothetical protein VLH13_02220, partial [Methanomassiliicoccales archaeon]|nr:hypothetical protein [Methanomassiliicoccales archaeon]
ITAVVAASKDGPYDAAAILQDILLPLGGKGGGNKQFATGGANVSGGGQEALDRGVSKLKSP